MGHTEPVVKSVEISNAAAGAAINAASREIAQLSKTWASRKVDFSTVSRNALRLVEDKRLGIAPARQPDDDTLILARTISKMVDAGKELGTEQALTLLLKHLQSQPGKLPVLDTTSIEAFSPALIALVVNHSAKKDVELKQSQDKKEEMTTDIKEKGKRSERIREAAKKPANYAKDVASGFVSLLHEQIIKLGTMLPEERRKMAAQIAGYLAELLDSINGVKYDDETIEETAELIEDMLNDQYETEDLISPEVEATQVDMIDTGETEEFISPEVEGTELEPREDAGIDEDVYDEQQVGEGVILSRDKDDEKQVVATPLVQNEKVKEGFIEEPGDKEILGNTEARYGGYDINDPNAKLMDSDERVSGHDKYDYPHVSLLDNKKKKNLVDVQQVDQYPGVEQLPPDEPEIDNDEEKASEGDIDVKKIKRERVFPGVSKKIISLRRKAGAVTSRLSDGEDVKKKAFTFTNRARPVELDPVGTATTIVVSVFVMGIALFLSRAANANIVTTNLPAIQTKIAEGYSGIQSLAGVQTPTPVPQEVAAAQTLQAATDKKIKDLVHSNWNASPYGYDKTVFKDMKDIPLFVKNNGRDWMKIFIDPTIPADVIDPIQIKRIQTDRQKAVDGLRTWLQLSANADVTQYINNPDLLVKRLIEIKESQKIIDLYSVKNQTEFDQWANKYEWTFK